MERGVKSDQEQKCYQGTNERDIIQQKEVDCHGVVQVFPSLREYEYVSSDVFSEFCVCVCVFCVFWRRFHVPMTFLSEMMAKITSGRAPIQNVCKTGTPLTR